MAANKGPEVDRLTSGSSLAGNIFQVVAREEEEEAQETSLPLDFGDSLPPRLTPLVDKQFRDGGKRRHIRSPLHWKKD